MNQNPHTDSEVTNPMADLRFDQRSDEMVVIPYVITRSYGDYRHPWSSQPNTKRTFGSARISPDQKNERFPKDLCDFFDEEIANFMVKEGCYAYRSVDEFMDDDDISICQKPRFSIHYFTNNKWEDYNCDYAIDQFKKKRTEKTGEVFSDDEDEEEEESDDEQPVLK